MDSWPKAPKMVRFYLKHVERKPDPEPVKVNAKLAVGIGTTVWIIALLALLAAPQSLPLEEPLALTTCAIGAILGFWGLWHVRKR